MGCLLKVFFTKNKYWFLLSIDLYHRFIHFLCIVCQVFNSNLFTLSLYLSQLTESRHNTYTLIYFASVYLTMSNSIKYRNAWAQSTNKGRSTICKQALEFVKCGKVQCKYIYCARRNLFGRLIWLIIARYYKIVLGCLLCSVVWLWAYKLYELQRNLCFTNLVLHFVINLIENLLR